MPKTIGLIPYKQITIHDYKKLFKQKNCLNKMTNTINFPRFISDLAKAVRSLENSVEDFKTITTLMPEAEQNIIKNKLEQEIFEKEVKKMKIDELSKAAETFQNVMLSKSFYDSLIEELDEHRKTMKIKVDKEVSNIQEKLQLQLQTQLNAQKIQYEKDIAVLNMELNFFKEKIQYVCLLNNFVMPVPPSQVVQTPAEQVTPVQVVPPAQVEQVTPVQVVPPSQVEQVTPVPPVPPVPPSQVEQVVVPPSQVEQVVVPPSQVEQVVEQLPPVPELEQV